MGITIKKVETSKELKKFIRFNYEMYKENPFSVPDLYDDMLNTFSRDKNAAFEFCEADYFLAYKDNKLVGRVAAIMNNRANETWNKKEVRFGWIDFMDDAEVSDALLKTVEAWGKERGATEIVGPLGFTDFDAEGMLIEGFEQLSTMSTIYNFPYYPQHMENLGYEKDADWVEFKIYIPDAIPDKHKRISEIIMRKYGLKIVSTHGGVAYNPADLEGTMAKWRELFAGLQTMGAKYCVIPGQDFGSTLADIEACCAFCNKVGEVAKEYGLKLGYHNHAGDFAKVEGETILDYVIKHTDADKFLIELDVCKTNMGDADYMHYLKTYGDRIKILHAKEDGVLGTGPINFEQVFNQFYANGYSDFVVEQEMPRGPKDEDKAARLATMWEGVAKSAAYLKNAEFVK